MVSAFVELINGLAMNDHAIDDTHSRAICEEVGERLQVQLKPPPPDDETDLQQKLARLSDQEATKADAG
jgi:hypothetical protein